MDVREGEDKVQVVLTLMTTSMRRASKGMSSGIQRGDVVEVHGMPHRTTAGELSVKAIAMNRLTPCLINLPNERHPLHDIDKIIRHRHLDLLSNPSKLQIFRQRAKILSHDKSHSWKGKEYVEVETPILSSQVGGAMATPFVTTTSKFAKHPLYLRIAPELYLKQCIVSGMRKVYELGKVFRNEGKVHANSIDYSCIGVDASHNPEFTSMEFYAAYQDTNDVMSLLETMISDLAIRLHGDAMIEVGEEGREGELVSTVSKD